MRWDQHPRHLQPACQCAAVEPPGPSVRGKNRHTWVGTLGHGHGADGALHLGLDHRDHPEGDLDGAHPELVAKP